MGSISSRFDYLPGAPLAQAHMIRKQIECAARQLQLREPIFLYMPLGRLFPLCGLMKRDHFIVHTCIDEPIEPDYERRYVEVSDRTLVIPRSTYHKFRAKFGSKVEIIRQSVDFQGLTNGAGTDMREPGALSAIPRPRLAYLGPPSTRLNIPVLQSLLRSHPGWHFVSVGPNGAVQLPNAHALPWMPATAMGDYIRNVEIGFMPYNCHNELNRHCVPLKLFDCFAFGIPVVSTPLIHLWEYKDLIYFGDTAEELARAVEQALEEPHDSPKRAARIAIARMHSLENLASELRACLPLDVEEGAAVSPRSVGRRGETNPLPVSVVIPTYRRPGPLTDCLRSLVPGSQRPHEIIVVGREGDTPTREALARAQEFCAGKTALRAAWVTEPGHIPPVKKGLEIVAFVDDDVTVTPEWLGHLCAPFDDPSVGVVGGRVLTASSKMPRLRGKPGCISWYGKHWGNLTSLEGDSPVDVEAAMECNWAWRRQLLASLKFDPVLNADDGSMYGLDLCLQATRKGYRVLYQPRAAVHHHVAPRAPDLDRSDRTKRDFSYSRNYTYIMLKHLRWWQRPFFLGWWFLIGGRGSWGLGSVLADALTGRLPLLRDVWSALAGKVQGIHLAASGARACDSRGFGNEPEVVAVVRDLR